MQKDRLDWCRKLANPGLFFVYLHPFHNTLTNLVHTQFKTELNKLRGCAWDSNPELQDERMVGADESTDLWWKEFKRVLFQEY